jgi:hypothetical protein
MRPEADFSSLIQSVTSIASVSFPWAAMLGVNAPKIIIIIICRSRYLADHCSAHQSGPCIFGNKGG